jgi:hypothetical protein
MLLMAKSPTIAGKIVIVSKPKKTTQGQGQHSRPRNGRKKMRGQGR